MRRLLLPVLAWLWASAAGAQSLDVRLTPGPLDTPAGRGSVGVTLVVTDVETAAGAPLLTLPIVIANTETVATTLRDLAVSDDAGPVPLAVRDDPPAIAYARHWVAGRAVKGTLRVSYAAPVDNTPPARGSGPPYSLRTEGGGISGVGNTFILLPESPKPHHVRVSWDLSRLAAGSGAMSSFGDGDVELAPGTVTRLHAAVFMAGPMRRHPTTVRTGGFSAAWLGDPPFDPRPLMSWAERLHGWMSGFFDDPARPPYRVVLRYNPINAGGGAAMTNAFLLTWGETARDPERLKGTLAHEMVHTWTNVGLGQWWGEGIAVHYQARLPLRAGLITPEAFLDDLNGTARRYYTNALNRTPDAEIAPRFWEDTRIRTLPYDRGAMYFAVLDGRIRRASGGRRSLDDLTRELVRLRRGGGQAVTDAVWLALLRRELGEAGPRLHADMLAGALMLPKPGDFGPCFTRTIGRFRRFELGFDPRSLVGDVKIIRSVVTGSGAARAGLRDGDVVTYAVALDSVQGDPARTLTLQVTRRGRTFPITYLPRGERVEAWQWRRVQGVPDSHCA